MLLLFIFMNSDFLDSTPVGISHTCPHNSPTTPAGKCDERSNITRKMGESKMGIRPAECFPVCIQVCLFVCVHATQPIEAICPALVCVPMEHFPQLRLKPTH